MTNQTAFNKVARHLLTQNARCVNSSNACVYRGPKGLKCAIGALIPDDQYKRRFDTRQFNTDDLVDVGVPALQGLDPSLLRELQVVHDVHAVEFWPWYLIDVANKFNLRVPKFLEKAAND